MNKKNTMANRLIGLAEEILEVLYKIFRGIFILIPVLWERLKRLFRFSLSFKISFVYSLLLLFALMFFSLLMMGFFSVIVGRESIQIVNTSLDRLQERADREGMEILIQRQDDFLPTGKTILYVYNTREETIMKSQADAPALEFKKPLDNFNLYFSQTENETYLSILRSFQSSGNLYYLHGAYPIRTYMWYFLWLFLILSGISLIIFIILPAFGFRLSKKMLEPIRKITQDAKEISLFNLEKRIDIAKTQDELKDLSETFNEMLDRLQSSYEKQYRFISDASHELRTPISVIQGYAGILSRWGKDDKKVLEESVEAIRNESENMKDLIEKLLFIARSESKHQPLEKSLFSIDELLTEISREYRLVDQEHIFHVETQDRPSLYADRKLIKQALRIFMDNAVKYTPAGGTISLSAFTAKDKLIFKILDTGIGISKEDLPKIFDRFYRADTSRDKKSGGSGLGLSIAKVILDLHNGVIKVFSTPGQGTEIQLIFQIKETLRLTQEKENKAL